jgi:hypothetical protein
VPTRVTVTSAHATLTNSEAMKVLLEAIPREVHPHLLGGGNFCSSIYQGEKLYLLATDGNVALCRIVSGLTAEDATRLTSELREPSMAMPDELLDAIERVIGGPITLQ